MEKLNLHEDLLNEDEMIQQIRRQAVLKRADIRYGIQIAALSEDNSFHQTLVVLIRRFLDIVGRNLHWRQLYDRRRRKVGLGRDNLKGKYIRH